MITCRTFHDDIVSKTWKKDGKDRLKKKCWNIACKLCSVVEFLLLPWSKSSVGAIVGSNFLLNSHNHSTAPLIILVFDYTCVTVFCSRMYKLYVWVEKTDLDFLRWQGKVQKAQTIQDTCKKQEKVKNHGASFWDWVVNRPDKRRQLMFKYASLVTLLISVCCVTETGMRSRFRGVHYFSSLVHCVT